MKKTIIKISASLVAFFLSLVIISGIMNMGNTDLTVEMSEASFPLVYVILDNEQVNCLHGYSGEMQGNYLRDTITVLPENRNLPVSIETFGTGIGSISYEVRSMDTTRLVENTEVLNFVDKGDVVNANLTIKELIDPDTEYILAITLNLESGRTAKYYTRIIQTTEDLNAGEKIKFVRNFTQKTFDKSNAKDLALYLESNASGDNSNYGKVDIHSSFSQITWGDLEVTQLTDPIINVKEMNISTASFELTYQVSTKNGKDTEIYNVTEYYRIRQGAERFYLLDFERRMNQIFFSESDVYANNKIMLGILEKEPEYKENEDGSVVCFVIENALYSYNITDGKLARLFSFYDEGNFDERTLYKEHSIEILTVDEGGNVQFLVYGYMNRGRREGEVGISVYRYDSQINAIEEEVYLPYGKSYDLLKENVRQLSYINNRNILYILLDGTIFGIDLLNKNYAELVGGLTEGRFVVSNNNSMVAWQDGDGKYHSDKLILKNLNSSAQSEIQAGSGNVIAPLGFMEDDLVYGIARQSDVVKDSAGTTVFPMYALRIQNRSGETLKEKDYSGQEVYILSVELVDNVINMSRVRRGEGGFEVIGNDQIMNTLSDLATKNQISTVVTESREKIVQLALQQSIPVKSLRFLTPREVLYEGAREIRLQSSEPAQSQYYVYSVEGVVGVYVEPAAAVNRAMEVAGVVVNDSCRYVWERGNRKTKTQITALEGERATEEKSGLAICLDKMLGNEGVLRNTQYLLDKGETALSILRDNLEAQVLDLTGCTLEAALYYVSVGNPVLVTLNSGESVLIVGYDEKNIIVMDTTDGSVGRRGMNDSTEWFEANGNKFITYIK